MPVSARYSRRPVERKTLFFTLEIIASSAGAPLLAPGVGFRRPDAANEPTGAPLDAALAGPIVEQSGTPIEPGFRVPYASISGD